MVRQTDSRVYSSMKRETLYMTIPKALAQDSACPVKDGDKVTITIDGDRLIIEKKKGGED